MSIARVVNREIERQKKKIVESFTSRGAYSKDKGIRFTEIYGAANRNLVGFIQQMIRKGHIKTDGDIYWLDFAAYEKEQKRNKRAYSILVGFTIFAVVFFYIVMYFFQ